MVHVTIDVFHSFFLILANDACGMPVVWLLEKKSYKFKFR